MKIFAGIDIIHQPPSPHLNYCEIWGGIHKTSQILSKSSSETAPILTLKFLGVNIGILMTSHLTNKIRRSDGCV